MSMLLTAKAMSIKVGNPLRKLVLVKLADNANDQGMCFPSYQYIADVCEISKRSAINHIDALIEMGLVSKKERKNKDGSSSNIYFLHLDKGSEIPAHPSAGDSLGSAGDAHPPSAGDAPITSHSINQSINHNNSLQPKTATTTPRKKFHFSEADMNLAKSIFTKIRQLNPSHREPNLKAWANELRLMVERDGKSQAEIFDLFSWANQDSFWQANILSPKKLREKWDVLILQRSRKKPQGRVDNLSQAWNTPEAWEGVL